MNRERAPFVLTPDFEYVLGKRVGVVCLCVCLVITGLSGCNVGIGVVQEV